MLFILSWEDIMESQWHRITECPRLADLKEHRTWEKQSWGQKVCYMTQRSKRWCLDTVLTKTYQKLSNSWITSTKAKSKISQKWQLNYTSFSVFVKCKCSKALKTNCSTPSYFRFHYIPLYLHPRQKEKGLLPTVWLIPDHHLKSNRTYIESQNGLGSKGSSKLIWSKILATSRAIFHQTRLLWALSSTKSFQAWASTSFLGNLCQSSTALLINNFFLLSSLNLPFFNVKLLPPALLLHALLKRMSTLLL